VIPEAFCLKVITPGVVTFDYMVRVTSNSNDYPTIHVINGKLTNPNPQIVPAIWSLNAQGQLVMKMPSQYTGNLGGFVSTSGTSSFMRAQPSTKAGYAFLTCTIKTDEPSFPEQPVLKCTTPQTGGAFTRFRVMANGFNFVYGTRDMTTKTANNYLIDLGVFTGAQCV
jgi:hypothetical protein